MPIATVLALALLVATVATSATTAAAANSTYEDCKSRLGTLERALFDSRDNAFQLNDIFFPPIKRPSRFIKVFYSFFNETGGEDGCNVTYFWAIGGFLFFQPPSLFKFNSLFFNYPNNDLNAIYIRLPYECRPLILVNSTECTCTRDSNRLGILTKQVILACVYVS